MLDLERHPEVIQEEPPKDVTVCHFGLQLQTLSKSQHLTQQCVSDLIGRKAERASRRGGERKEGRQSLRLGLKIPDLESFCLPAATE